MKQNSEDIDLLELFLILWKGKWVVILFILIAVSSRWAIFLYEKTDVKVKPIYETRLELSYEFIPLVQNHNSPLLNEKKLFSDFKKMYGSEDLFNKWESIQDQPQIDYESFNDEISIDGIIFKKEDSRKLVKIEQNHIIVRYDTFSFLSEIIDYTSYINDKLNSKIYSNLKEQYQLLDKILKKLYSNYPEASNYIIVQEMVKIDQIINALDKGQQPINIKTPTNPINVSPSNTPVLSFINIFNFAFLGAMVGAFFVFLRNALLRRKINLSDI